MGGWGLETLSTELAGVLGVGKCLTEIKSFGLCRHWDWTLFRRWGWGRGWRWKLQVSLTDTGSLKCGSERHQVGSWV